MRTSFAQIANGSQGALGWSQVASGVENSGPFAMQPVISAAIDLASRFRAGAHYDFTSLQLEGIIQNSEFWGFESRHSLALTPEVKSFSFKYGFFADRELWRGRLGAALQAVTSNSWGYGISAEDLESTAGGRSLVLPTQIYFVFPDALPQLSFSFSVEHRAVLIGAAPINRWSLIVSLFREFAW